MWFLQLTFLFLYSYLYHSYDLISILTGDKHIYLGYPKTIHLVALLLTWLLRFKVEKTYLLKIVITVEILGVEETKYWHKVNACFDLRSNLPNSIFKFFRNAAISKFNRNSLKDFRPKYTLSAMGFAGHPGISQILTLMHHPTFLALFYKNNFVYIWATHWMLFLRQFLRVCFSQ